MKTEERQQPSSTSKKLPAVSSEAADVVEKSVVVPETIRYVAPAKLPPHSRAAAAQRLNDIPLPPERGVHYDVEHLQVHPTGWRTKRHLKRKNLHSTSLRQAAFERFGTRWALMPMAMVTLVVIVVLSTVLVALSAVLGATNQHYGQQVTTLPDILPKDNLKAYDVHGTLLYQVTNQGLQTTVPLGKISPNLQNAEIAIEDQNFMKNSGYDI